MRCADKVAYATLRTAAESAVEQLQHGRRQRAYACDRCSRYHLTSQPMRGSSNITDEQVLTLATAVGARNGS